ncbi:MAG: flagellar biosynthetic protein FliR [Blastocatellia bacterium]|nr:flagellar biosynthetic protein FliR [Blastocatellia bacterium]
MDPIVIPMRPVLLFVVVLARAGGLATFAPFWSNRSVPVRVRAVLALVLALVLTPAVAPRLPTPPADALGLAVVILGELLIGCGFGFAGRLVFSALDAAAEVFGQQLGLSLAGVIDPSTQARTTALGTIAQMFGLMVLLSADGHHWLLSATVQSFGSVAPGSFAGSRELAQLMLRLSADALAVGVALAAPSIIVLLAVEFLLAFVGRAAPQLQVILLGFPIKFIAGLWLMGSALYFMPGAVRGALNAIKGALGRVLEAM